MGSGLWLRALRRRVSLMSDFSAIEQVARASAIATIAHRGASDKIGEPYIEHPAAVAAHFDPDGEWLEHSAAWLHDVIEDTDITGDDLLAAVRARLDTKYAAAKEALR